MLGIDIEAHARVLRPQVRRPKGPGTAATVAGGGAQHDILRQVLIEAPKAIAGPRAQSGVGTLADMATGLERELCAVVVVQRPERAHHSEVVGAGADIREPVAHLQPALPVLLVAGLERHDGLAVAVGGVAPHNIGIDPLGVQYGLVRGFFYGLARVLVELRLDIEALKVADPAAEEDPDHRLGLRRLLRCRRLCDTILEEKRAQSEPREAHPRVG